MYLFLINLLIWGLYGLIAGFIVHLFDPKNVKGGIFSTLLLGLLGAVFGGFLATALFGSATIGFSMGGLLTAVIGGVILSIISRLVFRDNRHIKTTNFR